MHHSSTRTIAVGGVRFRFRILASPPFTGSAYKYYPRDFRSARRCLSVIAIDVTDADCSSGNGPILSDESGCLSVQDDETGRCIRLHQTSSAQPHTAARINPDSDHVKIHVGQDRNRDRVADGSFIDPLGTVLPRLLLTDHLASRNGIVVHAAGVVQGKQALVFPGISTAGKSTLIRSFQGAGRGSSVLGDERIVLRLAPGGRRTKMEFSAWGTPWTSDARVARNATAPLGALFFLVKSEKCTAVRLSPAEAMRRLMPAVSFPWYDEQLSQSVLDTCGRLVEGVPSYDLYFRPGDEVVRLLRSREWA